MEEINSSKELFVVLSKGVLVSPGMFEWVLPSHGLQTGKNNCFIIPQ